MAISVPMAAMDVPEGAAHRLPESIRSMLPTFLLSNTDKIYTLLASAGAVGSTGWFLSVADEGGMSKYGAIGCIAVCASVATAFWKTRAGTIKAQADARAADSETNKTATQALIRNITEANDRQVERLEKDLQYARDRADTAERIGMQERIGKHDAVEQLYALALHTRLIEEICSSNHIELPPGPKIEFGRIVKAQDAQAARLLEERVEASKDAHKKTVRVELPAVVTWNVPRKTRPQPAPPLTPDVEK